VSFAWSLSVSISFAALAIIFSYCCWKLGKLPCLLDHDKDKFFTPVSK